MFLTQHVRGCSCTCRTCWIMCLIHAPCKSFCKPRCVPSCTHWRWVLCPHPAACSVLTPCPCFLCLQVPLKVWQSCSQLAQAAAPNKAILSILAASVMLQFCDAAVRQDGTVIGSSTLRRLLQQLSQSGLLLHLPMLLTAAACKVEASAAAAAAACGDSSLAAFHSTPHAGGAAPGSTAQAEPAAGPQYIALHALSIVSCIHMLQPESFSTTEGVACLLPSMRMVVAAMRYLSTLGSVLQHTALASLTSGLLQVWAQATRCCVQATMLATHAVATSATQQHGTGSPAAAQLVARQLVSSVHFTEYACLATAVWILMPAVFEQVWQRRQRQGVVQGPEDWQLDLLSLYALADSVPAPVADLLQQCGCSKEAALLAAGFAQFAEPDMVVGAAAAQLLPKGRELQVFSSVLMHLLRRMPETRQELQSGVLLQDARQQQEQARVVRLQLLMSVALLHHAAGRAAGQLNTDAALCCLAAGTTAFLAVRNAAADPQPGEQSQQGVLPPRGLPASIGGCKLQIDLSIAQSIQQYLALILPRLTQAERTLQQGTTSSSSSTAGTTGRASDSGFRHALNAGIGCSSKLVLFLAVHLAPPGPDAGQSSQQGKDCLALASCVACCRTVCEQQPMSPVLSSQAATVTALLVAALDF